MQEVLSKTTDSDMPLRDQEFYELRLEDQTDAGRVGFAVHQAHFRWSEADGDIKANDIQVDSYPSFEEAETQYSSRRKILADSGFIYSDMDPIL